MSRTIGILGPTACGGLPCHSYSTPGQTVTVERAVPAFTLAATPDFLPAGGSVTFTPTIAPTAVANLAIPWRVDSMRWAPDVGTGGLSAPCAGACTRTVTKSGRMTAFGTVNGQPRTATARVHVGPPDLELTADPVETGPGQEVTFTGRIVPEGASYNVVSWSWQPGPVTAAAQADSVLSLQRAAADRPASSDATADSPSFEDADTVLYVHDGDIIPSPDLPATEPCSHRLLVCAIPVSESGTMTLEVDIEGTRSVKSVAVVVKYGCPAEWSGRPTSITYAAESAYLQGSPTPITGSFPIVLYGPWFLLEAPTRRGPDLIGWYAPTRGTDVAGRVVYPPETSVRFKCKVYATRNSQGEAVYDGELEFDNRANAAFIRPR